MLSPIARQCRTEFNYALLRKGVRAMLAIIMEPEMRDSTKWSGVVGAKLGQNLYVDLSADEGTRAWLDGVEQIVREITSRQEALQSRKPYTSARNSENSGNQPLVTCSSNSGRSSGEKEKTIAMLPVRLNPARVAHGSHP